MVSSYLATSIEHEIARRQCDTIGQVTICASLMIWKITTGSYHEVFSILLFRWGG